VLLNGVYGAPEHFDALRRALGPAAHARAFTFHRAGLPDPDPLASDPFAPVVARLGRALGPDHPPVVLFGFSLGGALALEYALVHPERVAAIVVVNGYDRYSGSLFHSSTLPLVREWPIAWTHPRLGARIVHRVPWLRRGLFHDEAPLEVIVRGLQSSARHITQDDVRFQLAFVSLPAAPGNASRLAALARRVPVLLVSSRNDAVVPPAHTQRLAAAMPDATWLPAFEGGHAFFQHEAGDLAAAVSRFLASTLAVTG
jgi:pimeloyl-ACP methyl ester carboxylesterase